MSKKDKALNTLAEIEAEISRLTPIRDNLITEIGDDNSGLRGAKAHLDSITLKISDSITVLQEQEKSLFNKIKDKDSGLEKVISDLETEISNKTQEKNNLDLDISKLKSSVEELELNFKTTESNHNKKIEELNKDKSIIQNLVDFKLETKKHMEIYYWAIIFVSLAFFAILGTAFYVSVLDAFKVFEKSISGDEFRSYSVAISLFILKLPVSIVLVFFIAGGYKLIKSLIITYESINKDIRNTSSICAIVSSMNAESKSIIEGKEIDFNNKDSVKDVQEKLKWNQISGYFQKMNNNVENLEEIDNKNSINLPIKPINLNYIIGRFLKK